MDPQDVEHPGLELRRLRGNRVTQGAVATCLKTSQSTVSRIECQDAAALEFLANADASALARLVGVARARVERLIRRAQAIVEEHQHGLSHVDASREHYLDEEFRYLCARASDGDPAELWVICPPRLAIQEMDSPVHDVWMKYLELGVNIHVIWALDLVDEGVLGPLVAPMRQLDSRLAQRPRASDGSVIFHRTCITSGDVDQHDAQMVQRSAEFDSLRGALRGAKRIRLLDFTPLAADQRRKLAPWSCRHATVPICIPRSTWRRPRGRAPSEPLVGFIVRDVRSPNSSGTHAERLWFVAKPGSGLTLVDAVRPFATKPAERRERGERPT